MTFDIEKKRIGRIPAVFIEIHFDSGVERFGNVVSPIGIKSRTMLSDWESAPSRITSGQGLGHVGQIEFSLLDTKTDGDGGTYLGRMLARNPFWLNREVRLRIGYLTEPFSWDNFNDRVYYLEELNPTTDSGILKGVAKSPIKRLNSKRSEMPLTSTAEIMSEITDDGFQQFEISNTTNIPESGVARVDDEIFTFTRVDSLVTILARAQFGTEIEAHEEESNFQQCEVFDEVNILDAARYAMTTFGNIDASMIDVDNVWNVEKETYATGNNINVCLSEPEPVEDFIANISMQYFVEFFVDERINQIVPKVGGLRLEPPRPFFEHQLIQGSLSFSQDMDDLATRVVMKFDRRNQTSDKLSRTAELIDSFAELPTAHGIVSRYIIDGLYVNSEATTNRVGVRLQQQLSFGRREGRFQLDRKYDDLWVGDVFSLTGSFFQDEQGNDGTAVLQVIEVDESESADDILNYSFAIINSGTIGRFGVIAPNGLPDYPLQSENQQSRYVSISQNDGLYSNGDAGHLIL